MADEQVATNERETLARVESLATYWEAADRQGHHNAAGFAGALRAALEGRSAAEPVPFSRHQRPNDREATLRAAVHTLLDDCDKALSRENALGEQVVGVRLLRDRLAALAAADGSPS